VRALTLVFAISACLPALGNDLDPGAIAQRYAHAHDLEREHQLALWRPGAAPPQTLPTLAPAPTLADLLREASAAQLPARAGDPALLESLGFQGQTGVLAKLAGLQSKMFVALGTYDSDSDLAANVRQGHFAGLAEAAPRGRTLSLASGAVLGDLRFSVGTVRSQADLAQLLTGEATLVQLNPVRDVRAQFDLAFASLPRGLRKRLPPPLLIVRLSAAYLDAFTKASSGSNSSGGVDTNSEVGLAVGLSW
jgi:hypothetical protein